VLRYLPNMKLLSMLIDVSCLSGGVFWNAVGCI
jgi:hypothetical protein